MLSPHLPADRMRAVIADGPPDAWPDGWHTWANTREAVLSVAAEFAAAITPPADVGSGRGIVTSAGPRHFPSLYVMLRRLRELGCTLPVEVWHLNELDPCMVRILNDLGADCVDATALRGALPWRIVGGWQLKPYAALYSRFADVLWLDADSIPRRDVTALFDWPEYAETGAVVWPDFPVWSWTAEQWRAFGLEPRQGQPSAPFDAQFYGVPIPPGITPPHETGQWLIDKRRRWRELRLAGWWCEHSDYTFRHAHGDVGVLQVAFAATGEPLAVPPFWPSYDTHTTLQHDFAGGVIFGHRTQGKFEFGKDSARNTQPDENRLHEVAAELPALWSGTAWDNTARRSPREQAVADRLTADAWAYRRVGLDERPMTFRDDGTVDHGAAGCERRWRVFESGGRCRLYVWGDYGLTFEAEPDSFGVWRGAWRIGERCPVELVPGGPGRWAERVAVPAPPRLHLTPRSDRAVVTVAAGEYGRELFAVSGPAMKAYADRLGADLVVLDWPGHPDWPMSSKYGVGAVLEHYERIVYLDADVLVPADAPDLFALTPDGKFGAVDESPHVPADAAVPAEYRWVCRQQGAEPGPFAPYVNAGVFVCDRSHAPLLAPPSRPIPPLNLAEQHLLNARLKAAGCWHPLPRACNWQWWTDPGFATAPAGAVLHVSSVPDRAERVRVMRERVATTR
jgi:hypothetical protein